MRRAPTSRSQRGFVLALTLGVLAAVIIAATFIAESVRISLQTAKAANDRAEAEEKLFNARAEFLFRMATDPRGVHGLGALDAPLKLDGSLYKDDDDVLVQVQDARGLFSLAGVAPDTLVSLLRSFGIASDEALAMVDVLNDYTDADNLRRLNGAEAADYEALGLPPPRNQPLISPSELRAMPRWRDHKELWKKGFFDAVAVIPNNMFNPNTAPEAVLAAYPGVSTDTAHALIELRNTGRVINASDFEAIGGARVNAIYSPISTFPSDTLSVTHWVPGLARGERMLVMLTPSSQYGPWRVLYYEHIETPQKWPPDGKIPPLPPRSGRTNTAAPALLPGFPGS